MENGKWVTDKPIDLAKFLAQKPSPSCGAVASFVGVVRNHHQGKSVSRIYYDCYPKMANQQIQQIVEKTRQDYAADDIRVLHRVGWLEVGEVAVAITVSAAHRQEAFSACRAVIEGIKTTVPIWKKEIYTDGTYEWVTGFCGAVKYAE